MESVHSPKPIASSNWLRIRKGIEEGLVVLVDDGGDSHILVGSATGARRRRSGFHVEHSDWGPSLDVFLVRWDGLVHDGSR